MEYYNPVRLLLGSGVREKIAEECIDKRVLIFCTASAFTRHKQDHALNSLLALPNIIFEHAFSSNPSLSDISGISQKYQKTPIDLVIGLGGGSAMDVAKIACVSIPAYQKGIEIDDRWNWQRSNTFCNRLGLCEPAKKIIKQSSNVC
jgi:alcohol dehydrogenase class IV